MAATEGTDMAQLDKRNPKIASAVRLMAEQEEKEEGELEKGSKSGPK